MFSLSHKTGFARARIGRLLTASRRVVATPFPTSGTPHHYASPAHHTQLPDKLSETSAREEVYEEVGGSVNEAHEEGEPPEGGGEELPSRG